MSEFNKLALAVWQCKYDLIWCSKYRFKILKGTLQQSVEDMRLDKTGGLTEALRLQQQARRLNLGIMVGCMVSTSLAIAPALLLAREADFIDLDGHLLLERDREPGLECKEYLILPTQPELWG